MSKPEGILISSKLIGSYALASTGIVVELIVVEVGVVVVVVGSCPKNRSLMSATKSSIPTKFIGFRASGTAELRDEEDTTSDDNIVDLLRFITLLSICVIVCSVIW